MLIWVPRPSGSPSLSSEMAKAPSALDSQMYLWGCGPGGRGGILRIGMWQGRLGWWCRAAGVARVVGTDVMKVCGTLGQGRSEGGAMCRQARRRTHAQPLVAAAAHGHTASSAWPRARASAGHTASQRATTLRCVGAHAGQPGAPRGARRRSLPVAVVPGDHLHAAFECPHSACTHCLSSLCLVTTSTKSATR